MRKGGRIIAALAIAAGFLGAPAASNAHPGRTDAYGCHTCRTNCPAWGLDYGEYHCHNAPAAPPATVNVSTVKPVTRPTAAAVTAAPKTVEIEKFLSEEEATRAYFKHINAGEFDEAFQIFSKSYQKSFAFKKWKEGYDHTILHSIDELSCVKNACLVVVQTQEMKNLVLSSETYTFLFQFTQESGQPRIKKSALIK